MADAVYPSVAPNIARARHEFAPEAQAAFGAFSRTVFADGGLSAKVKQIVAAPWRR